MTLPITTLKEARSRLTGYVAEDRPLNLNEEQSILNLLNLISEDLTQVLQTVRPDKAHWSIRHNLIRLNAVIQ